MLYKHSFKNYLRDTIQEHNRTTLYVDPNAIEFAKVTREHFQEALVKCPKILAVFQEQLNKVFDQSGGTAGMEAL